MTKTDYQSLKATLIQGCIEERRDLIDLLAHTPRRLFEFAEKLDMPYDMPSQMETWRYMTKICALVALNYVDRVDGEEDAALDALAASFFVGVSVLGFSKAGKADI